MMKCPTSLPDPLNIRLEELKPNNGIPLECVAWHLEDMPFIMWKRQAVIFSSLKCSNYQIISRVAPGLFS